MKALLIVLAIFGVFGLWMFGSIKGTYNSLVTQRSAVDRQYSDIQAQLQRRADLIPNLVATTKGAMKHEQAVFEDISKAQAAFTRAPQGSSEQLDAYNGLGTALRGYMVVAQQYPQLAALDIVKDLNTNLDGSENRISVARQRYNEEVEKYNNSLMKFPGNLIANFFDFEKKDYFAVQSPEDEKAPEIDMTLE
jgi:LemA protein